VTPDNIELAKAQEEGGTELKGEIYRIMICKGFTRYDLLGDYKKTHFEVNTKHLYFVGLGDELIYQCNSDLSIPV
jgi:hypothetical protein